MTTALASVHSSNMPSHHKSAIRRLWEQAKGGASVFGRAGTHLRVGGETLRQGSESLIVGGALAVAHVELPTGLDQKVGGVTVPIDGAVAAIGLLGGVALAHEVGGTDLRNAGAAAASVFAFRQTYKFAAEKKKAGGGKVGGTFGEDDDYGMNGEDDDPIVAAAREIGG